MLTGEDKFYEILDSIEISDGFYYDSHFILSDKVSEHVDYVISSGETKAAVVLYDFDIVIKIPFECQSADGGMEEFYDNCWDYCNTEMQMYKYAEKDGFSTFFEKTEFYMTAKGTDNMPIYIQNKVIPLCDRSLDLEESIKEESISLAKEINSNRERYTRLSDLWVAAAIEWYGEELVNEFLTWLDENPYGIGYDLHCGNVGFEIGTNKPVIFDYSGYNE